MRVSKVFLGLLVGLCVTLNANAYTKDIVDRIVYEFDYSTQCAVVVNFADLKGSVTIPAYVTYKNNKFAVIGLLKDTYTDSDRSEITELNLPNTMLYIGEGAFDGMKSLKSIVIPQSVIAFPDEDITIFNDFMLKLQSITILGLPEFEIDGIRVTYDIKDEDGNWLYPDLIKEKLNLYFCSSLETIYLPEFSRRVSTINAYNDANRELEEEAKSLNKSLNKLCPNLQLTILVPVLAEEVCTDTQTIHKAYNTAREYLLGMYNVSKDYIMFRDSLSNLLNMDVYYDGSELSYSTVGFDEISNLEQWYEINSGLLTTEYNKLKNGVMAENLRLKNPERYIAAYVVLNPDKKDYIMSLYKEYRCEYTAKQNEYIANYISSGNLTTTCRQSYWRQNSFLYDSKDEYDNEYDGANSDFEFRKTIETRTNANNDLTILKSLIIQNVKDFNVSNINKKPNAHESRLITLLDNLKKSYYYDKAVDFIIQNLPKVQKEYEKNGHYFMTKKQFFEAYSSDSYSKILRENKKKYK